jgi:hypothetical protein
VLDGAPGIPLEPLAIEVFRHDPKLNDQVARKVFGFDLGPLLSPQPNERASFWPMMIRASGRQSGISHKNRLVWDAMMSSAAPSCTYQHIMLISDGPGASTKNIENDPRPMQSRPRAFGFDAV